MKRSHYWDDDIVQLVVRPTPYLRLGNRGIRRFLEATREAGIRYSKFLALYPAVRCEPLDAYYQFGKAAASLDLFLLRDLLFAFDWRTANVGAWLAALAPRREFVPLLRERRLELPHGTTIIDLALSACGETPTEEHRELAALVDDIRRMLLLVSCDSTPLRVAPVEQIEAEYLREAEHIRTVYRAHGADQAWKLTQTGVVGYYLQSHARWLDSGAMPPPRRRARKGPE